MKSLRTAGLAGLMRECTEELGIPSISWSIIRSGHVDDHGAVGIASTLNGEPVAANTVYDVASVTKPVFAFAVHRLVADGKVNLDEPLANNISHELFESDPRSRRITPRHVLTHTTGLPNWRRHTGQLKTYFEPGTRFSYSGEGFALLQRLVEQVFEDDLEAVMQSQVFEPFNMASSSLALDSKRATPIAMPHAADGTPTTNSSRPLDSSKDAAGALQTTALDLANFMCGLISSGPVGLAMCQSGLGMSSSRSTDADWPDLSADLLPQVRWATGIGVEYSNAGTNFWQWGDNYGWKAFLIGCTDHGNGAVILTNSENGMRAVPPVLSHLSLSQETHPSIDWLRATSNHLS